MPGKINLPSAELCNQEAPKCYDYMGGLAAEPAEPFAYCAGLIITITCCHLCVTGDEHHWPSLVLLSC